MKNDSVKTEIDFLTNQDNYYLSPDAGRQIKDLDGIDLSDIALYRIDEVSFEDQAPRKEALENVLSTMRIDGIHFIYLILGDEKGVHFYYGVSRKYGADRPPELEVLDIGKQILEPSIKGNFRGSRTTEVEAKERKKVLETIAGMSEYSLLEGVPGSTKEDEKFQGVDRLADVMMGDRFGFMIVAAPASFEEVKEIEKNLYDVYSRIVPLAKKNIQSGTNSNESISTGTTSGSSESVAESYTKATQESVTITDGTNTTTTKTHGTSTSKETSTSKSSGDRSSGSSNSTSESGGRSKSEAEAEGSNHSEGKTTGGSESEGTTKTKGSSQGVSKQESKGSGSSETTSLEYIDKKSQDWIKYLDDVIIPRLDYGIGKGIFITTFLLFSDSKPVQRKLENTAISLYSGETGNKVPLRAFPLSKKGGIWKSLQSFELPGGQAEGSKTDAREWVSRSALSQYMREDRSFVIGNWITTNELAMIAGLPQKEVVGLALREEVEFGLNYQDDEDDVTGGNRIELGNLVQSGNELEANLVYLDKKSLDKHIFISGVTGSGKTTTSQKILCESELPFLVIEPAKTEYRIMTTEFPDLMVFTLGNENVGTPFRLNPFEFFPHESITSRVDMIKASIEAAFDMEAAIPQLIESAIYACYEDFGWNISKNSNEKFNDPFADGIYAFPTWEDLIDKIPSVVDEQGFDIRLKNDYLGSIRARLMGLLMGSKGMMLNTRRSVDFRELLDRKVVLELEEIRNGSEKSLIMGFILTNLVQAIKGRFLDSGIPHHHITLVEEAHRLLSKFVPGDSPSKKQGVETFADMLAEIRKYGESLIIVDQIPNKLTPEVLKNTNTKIVHKLFAADDKDAIGNTIVLDQDQREFLSNLKTGRAIVFSEGYTKALQVQVQRRTETDAEVTIRDQDLRDAVYAYYADHYQKGIIRNTQFLAEKPSHEELQEILEISKDSALCEAVYRYGKRYEEFPSDEVLGDMKKAVGDRELWNLYGEISKSEKDAAGEMIYRKPEQAELIRKYLEMFELPYFAELSFMMYSRAKEVKTGTDLSARKELLHSEKRLKCAEDYLKKYASDQEMTDAEVLEFHNKII